MKGEKSIQKSSESDEMASKPSWLDDEDNQEAVAGAAAKVAQNPVAQKAASKIANDPGVQSAVKSAAKDAAKEAIFGASSKPAEETPSNYPSWTSDTPSATATPVATPVKDIESGRASTTSTSEESKEFTMDAELLLNMQRWHLALRICYMIAAILLAASGVYALMQVYPPIETVFFAIYVIFFATVLCCFEVAIDVSGYLSFVLSSSLLRRLPHLIEPRPWRR